MPRVNSQLAWVMVGRHNRAIGMLEPDVGLKTAVVDDEQVAAGERPGGIAAPDPNPG